MVLEVLSGTSSTTTTISSTHKREMVQETQKQPQFMMVCKTVELWIVHVSELD